MGIQSTAGAIPVRNDKGNNVMRIFHNEYNNSLGFVKNYTTVLTKQMEN